MERNETNLTNMLKLPFYKRYLAVFGRHQHGGLLQQAFPLHLADSEQKDGSASGEARDTFKLLTSGYGAQ